METPSKNTNTIVTSFCSPAKHWKISTCLQVNYITDNDITITYPRNLPYLSTCLQINYITDKNTQHTLAMYHTQNTSIEPPPVQSLLLFYIFKTPPSPNYTLFYLTVTQTERDMNKIWCLTFRKKLFPDQDDW